MVKRFCFLILITLFFNACGSFLCDYTRTSQGGLRSKKLYKKYSKKTVDPSEMGIDVNSVYKMISKKYYENKKSVIYKNPSSKKQAVLVFTKDGRHYSFFGLNSITKKQINPLKGNLNYLIKGKKDKYHSMSYSPINCGSFSKNEIKIIRDTIMISAGSNKGHRIWYYYVKHKVPKEWLNFEPDI